MFTLKHMNRVLGEIKGLKKKSVFSIKKNALAYNLSQMNNQHRGAIVEKMVRDILIKHGKKVEHIGGNHSFDMRVDGRRVEIKSSMPCVVPNKNGGTLIYRFQNIKTQYFDKIILVYITPKGLIMKQYDKRTMAKMLKRHKYYSNGKTFTAKAA